MRRRKLESIDFATLPKRSHRQQGDRPSRRSVVLVVETYRRLNIPIRNYLGSVLPGLADRPISQTTELTPAAWGNRNRSATLPSSIAVYLVRRLPPWR